MSVIERWIATNPPNPDEYAAGWEPKALSNERDVETYRRLGWQVVEVVPAEQLRGAVEALREIVRIGSEPRDSMRSKYRDCRERGQAMLDAATAALRGR
jgi:hypothetical protein